ncbi:1-deoxy-D-xylulose-5-phosphate reductoisomerase [Candidatus Woesearchaeota archaeon]|nr:1-deoxy-D-xylulose-5-phosphate reductoisomerase [Candidatus Woesearchaeota archaeon]MDP6648130.1 1-deoxy-D-xylulose-5-phosphate reductoisomerase [Candidatus Woesearchaeota archaeon]
MKNISILGSTGSIGTQTLDIVKQFPDEFKVVGLTTNKNIDLLRQQINEFKPAAVAVMDKTKANELMNFTSTQVYSGIQGLNKIAALNEADTVVNSLVGSVGIEPTYNAARNKKNIALANKETLVAAGSAIINEIKKNDVKLMPIDSEHSAIFQCLNGENINDVNKITLTCSGGPFRNHSREQFEDVTASDALKHPTWNMGAKITIDSATLMNKGFEVLETHWLYGIDYKKIKIVIHPQSVIHSLVEFNDRSVIAQLGLPNMRIPIQYALTYPGRFTNMQASLDLAKIKTLDFKDPDFDMFPCLNYAYEAGIKGGTLPAVMNAANEAAVHAFLDNKIRFLDIPRLIRKMMDEHNIIKNPGLNDILSIDKNIKEKTKNIIEEEITIIK